MYTNPQPAAAEHVVLRAQRRLPQQHACRRPLQVCPGAWTDGRACEARRSSSSAQQLQSHASARTNTRARARNTLTCARADSRASDYRGGGSYGGQPTPRGARSRSPPDRARPHDDRGGYRERDRGGFLAERDMERGPRDYRDRDRDRCMHVYPHTHACKHTHADTMYTTYIHIHTYTHACKHTHADIMYITHTHNIGTATATATTGTETETGSMSASASAARRAGGTGAAVRMDGRRPWSPIGHWWSGAWISM